MNTKEYIESGIIEQFVMGLTTEEQSLEVMKYAKLYPEIQAEIEAVENSLIQIAESAAPKPKETTKEELFGKLFNENIDHQKRADGPVISTFTPQSKQIPFKKTYLVAASVALLVSTSFNILLYGRLKKSEDALMALNYEKQEFAGIIASQKSSNALLEDQLEKINSVNVVQVRLAGVNQMPDARAIIYYDTLSKEVYMHIAKLPAAPEDKQYQLWAIVDGKPVDAGVFDAESANTALLKMKNSAMPVTFAVTIEKKGGSISPTLEQMVLAGNLPS